MGKHKCFADCFLAKEDEINIARSYYHKVEQHNLTENMEECEKEYDMVPIVDEEEHRAKFINNAQNKLIDDCVPTDISNELGFDYFKDQDLKIKKNSYKKNELLEMFRTLNKKQKEIFLEIVNREENDIPYRIVITGRAGTGKSKLLKSINICTIYIS